MQSKGWIPHPAAFTPSARTSQVRHAGLVTGQHPSAFQLSIPFLLPHCSPPVKFLFGSFTRIYLLDLVPTVATSIWISFSCAWRAYCLFPAGIPLLILLIQSLPTSLPHIASSYASKL